MLAGRRVLVIGGAGAIGSAVCRAAATAGARVVVADRDERAAAELARALRGEALPVDLECPDAAADVVDGLAGPLHGVVNAAGIAERDPARVGADEWTRLLRTNLVAPVLVAERAADRMEPGGAIVNVTSIAGRAVLATSGRPTPAYAASKAALEHATRALAVVAAARSVRVNAVAPGFLDTPMTATAMERHGPWIASRTPLGRLVDPSDVADAVVFLLGDDARFVTGQTLVVDGGVTLGLLRPAAE